MKTDELIRLLSEDARVPMRLGRMLLLAIGFGVLVSGVLLVSTVGLRHNLVSAVETARVAFKIGATLLLAVIACGLALRIATPGVPTRPFLRALLLPLALLVAAIIAELLVLPPAAWGTSMVGLHPVFCIFFIPVLSLAPLVGLIWAMRDGAPEDPGLAGAAAGLAASAIGAALYAWHCPDDSPLFVATWYSLAIAIVTAAGYGIGRRVLRW